MPNAQGGWELVVRWLAEKRYHDAFQFVDHVVLQVDTDICEEPPLNIPKVVHGFTLPPAELAMAVRAKLESLIGDADLSFYAGRFHFAIAVHSLECWLLPLWGKQHEADGIHTCKQRVDEGLQREKQPGLRKDAVRTYAAASAEFRKRKQLWQAAEIQPSLALFLSSLEVACP